MSRRRISAKGARKGVRQAAVAVDVEAELACLSQGTLASPVLAGACAIPVVATLEAALAAASRARRVR